MSVWRTQGRDTVIGKMVVIRLLCGRGITCAAVTIVTSWDASGWGFEMHVLRGKCSGHPNGHMAVPHAGAVG